MAGNVVEKVDNRVKINTVLISVSDKSGLDVLVPGLVAANPDVRILSTGGTYYAIGEILGEASDKHLTQVSDYTGQPETQGGLVKTLDFKIYLGILTETYNDAHQADLKRTDAVAIDMVVVNLYPFREATQKDDATVETCRANIDIGGPCMVRAAAKNYLRVAAVVDPIDYPRVVEILKENDARLTLASRFDLARKAFDHTAEYDAAIADYLSEIQTREMRDCYTRVDEDA
ncbi:MAG: hypothetical protein H6684_05375 [Deltaproteobacteria bacterium]|nr:hypothetical protein [Deltaproteobacteria bacterium]MCB9479079.1 hypothetical protein [Deltaproteobacteria bacterium]MCB9488141.1 hypothetical protein [Deltaproteobacteria bacterium]